jgi:hypothetical protein
MIFVKILVICNFSLFFFTPFLWQFDIGVLCALLCIEK